MPSEMRGVNAFIVGDSVTSNSLGRVLSLAITAHARFETVKVLAYEDGPVWAGARQFNDDVETFTRSDFRRVAERIAASSLTGPTVVWVSKGADPISALIRLVRRRSQAVILADFDDNDVAIMKSFRAQSRVNALKMNPLRRKHPRRLARAQTRVAARADGLTFSNSALAAAYREDLGQMGKSWALVPHSRDDAGVPPSSVTANRDRLTLGFIGTVRAHKGAQELVALMRADPRMEFVSFSQAWEPPADCRGRWRSFAPDAPISQLYAEIDFLVLPMDASDLASVHQLPAKLVDAAVNWCPVIATPTPPIMEYASSGVVPVSDWSDAGRVLDLMASADRGRLAAGMRDAYTRFFSPSATGDAVGDLFHRLHLKVNGTSDA